MKRIVLMTTALVIFFLYPFSGFSEDMQSIQLPEPRMTGGKPLMEVLRERKSIRKFSMEKLPVQELSNLLWAGWGLNRNYKGSGINAPGSHTAPSAHNWQEVDVYVAMAEGLYLYEPISHVLKLIHKKDIRAAAGHRVQMFVKDAPVNLIYVSDLSKFTDMPPGDNFKCQELFIPYAHAGFISENAYLYCASEGLATVVRLMFDKSKLAEEMGLRKDQIITLEQPVGYPKNE